MKVLLGQKLSWLESPRPKEGAPGLSYQLLSKYSGVGQTQRDWLARSCQQSHIKIWSHSLLHCVSESIIKLKLITNNP